MGEHAALHGCPMIACTVGLYCDVWIEPRQDREIRLQLPDLSFQRAYSPYQLADYTERMRTALEHYRVDPNPGSFAALDSGSPDHLVKCAIGEILLRLAPQDWRGFTLRLQSQIPRGAGFGSSGALAVTLAAALLRLAPTDCPLESLAMTIERYQHGDPSGIDHNTSLRGGIVKGRRDAHGVFHPGELPASAVALLKDLKIFNTGTARESTGQVIAATRHRLEGADNALLASLQRNTERFASLLQQTRPMPETLRAVLRDYQADLETLGVVPAAIARTIRAIEKTGGAAKVCGAGALSGEQAGALLVLGGPPLTGYQPIDAPLAVPGLEISVS